MLGRFTNARHDLSGTLGSVALVVCRKTAVSPCGAMTPISSGDGRLSCHSVGNLGRMACNPRASRLQPRHLPPLCQPLAHCVERRLPVPDGAHQGCDAPPTREQGRGVGREETVAHGGTLQAPEDAKNHGPRCHGMPLQYGHGQAAPPLLS